MADKYLKEDGSGGYQLEDGSGNLLLEVPATGYAAAVLADSPLGYWRLGDASGQFRDASGNVHPTTSIHGSPTYGATGALTGDTDTAVTFTRDTNWGVVPDNPAFHIGNGDFTVEAWVAVPTADGNTQFFFGGWDPATDHGFTPGIGSNGSLRLYYGNGSGGEYAAYSVETPCSDTAFHHVVFTKASGVYKFYCDGVLLTTTGDTMPTYTDADVSWGIGAAGDSSSNSIGGTVDEVAFYGTALSGTRISAHYAAGTGGGGASPIVQTATGGVTSGTSFTVTLGATPTQGNVLVLSYGATIAGLISVSQTGVTWSYVTDNGANEDVGFWVGYVGPSAGTVITVTGFSSGLMAAIVDERSDINGFDAVDQYSALKTGTSTSPSTNALTPPANGYIVYAAMFAAFNTISSGPTGGYTGDTNSPLVQNTSSLGVAWLAQATAGSTSTGWTIPSGGWDALSVSFRPKTTTYAATIIADAPIGYWRAGESSGELADSSGHSHPTTAIVSTLTYGVAGAIANDTDTAITFTRTTSYATIPDSADFHVGNGDFTIEAWSKVGTPSGTDWLFGGWDPSAGATGHGFALGVSSGAPALYYGDGSGGNSTINSSTAPADDSNWHHVVVTKKSGVYTFYCDGLPLTTSGTMPTFTDANAKWAVGAAGDSTSNSYGGTLDEIAFYTHALNASQIAFHYLVGQYLGPVAKATPTLVQEVVGSTSTSGTLAVALGSTPVNGNTLIAVLTDADGGISTVTQSGVTWQFITYSGVHNELEIWYAPNVSGAGTSITVVGAHSGSSALIAHIMEWSGLTTAPLDVFGGQAWPLSGTGQPQSPNMPKIITTQDGDLVIAFFAVGDTRTLSAGPFVGFSSVTGSPISKDITLMATAYRIVGTPSSVECWWTVSGADSGDSVIASFKAAAAAVGASIVQMPYIGGGYYP